jgi:hypothetical protein
LRFKVAELESEWAEVASLRSRLAEIEALLAGGMPAALARK